jgi:hypothetical protein
VLVHPVVGARHVWQRRTRWLALTKIGHQIAKLTSRQLAETHMIFVNKVPRIPGQGARDGGIVMRTTSSHTDGTDPLTKRGR